MIIVNLFGVPGAGKSTGAAYIFSKLKMRGIEAELITEFAKDKVWENSEKAFQNQAYIFGQQSFRISRMENEVDIVITDSPLLLSAFYNTNPVLGESFNDVVANVFHSYNNINSLLTRVKPYHAKGRLQTEEESDALAEPMKQLLDKYNVSYVQVPGDIAGYDAIVEDIYTIWSQEVKHE